MTKKFNRWRIKGELRRVGKNAILLEALKNEAGMIARFVFVCTGTEDVISIRERKIETTKHVVYECLKCLSWISQTKRYPKEFV